MYVFDERDEKFGRWTKVRELEDRVEIHLRECHFRSHWVQVAIGGFFLWLAIDGWRDNPEPVPLAIVLGCSVAAFAYATKEYLRNKERSRLHLIIWDAPRNADEQAHDQDLYADQIEAVIVRKNWGRRSDDFGYYQLYLAVNYQHTCIHIFKDYESSRELQQMTQLAERLAARWGVVLYLDTDKEGQGLPSEGSRGSTPGVMHATNQIDER